MVPDTLRNSREAIAFVHLLFYQTRLNWRAMKLLAPCKPANCLSLLKLHAADSANNQE